MDAAIWFRRRDHRLWSGPAILVKLVRPSHHGGGHGSVGKPRSATYGDRHGGTQERRSSSPRRGAPQDPGSKLVQRLDDHIMGVLPKPLDMSQVRAIDILLKKCIPDLTRTLISADLNVRYVAELPS